MKTDCFILPTCTHVQESCRQMILLMMTPPLPPPSFPSLSFLPCHIQHSPSPTPTPVPGQQHPVLPPSMLSTSSSSSSSSTPCSTLFVANLELQHTEEEIRDIFKRCVCFHLHFPSPSPSLPPFLPPSLPPSLPSAPPSVPLLSIFYCLQVLPHSIVSLM